MLTDDDVGASDKHLKLTAPYHGAREATNGDIRSGPVVVLVQCPPKLGAHGREVTVPQACPHRTELEAHGQALANVKLRGRLRPGDVAVGVRELPVARGAIHRVRRVIHLERDTRLTQGLCRRQRHRREHQTKVCAERTEGRFVDRQG